MQRLTRILVMTLFAAGFHHAASAEVVTVFGQDLPEILIGPDGLPYDYIPRVGHVNADVAALQFATMSSGLGTETFEDDVAGTHGPLDFGNGVTASVTTGLFSTLGVSPGIGRASASTRAALISGHDATRQ